MAMRENNLYPRLVSVETTNYCNATCGFCPNNALSRDKTHMSDELFDKIVDDCTEFPLKAIEPFLQGEPFSDPKIMYRMEKIRSKLPKTKLRLYSNGNAMTPKKIDQLVGMGIDHIFISVNTLDPDKYKEVMGLKLEKTLENLAYLTDPVRKKRVANKFTFRMTRLADTTLEDQDTFVEYCKQRGAKPAICGLFNYKGDTASDLPVPGYPCEHTTRLDILASGKVTLCCMDQDAEYSWGDVNRHSVLEVYRGKTASWFRDMHASGRRKQAEPCDTCTHYWPGYIPGMSVTNMAKFLGEFAHYHFKHRPAGRLAPRGLETSVVNPGKLESIKVVNQRKAEERREQRARQREQAGGRLQSNPSR